MHLNKQPFWQSTMSLPGAMFSKSIHQKTCKKDHGHTPHDWKYDWTQFAPWWMWVRLLLHLFILWPPCWDCFGHGLARHAANKRTAEGLVSLDIMHRSSLVQLGLDRNVELVHVRLGS